MKRLFVHALSLVVAAGALAATLTLASPQAVAAWYPGVCWYGGTVWAESKGLDHQPFESPDATRQDRFWSTVRYQVGYGCGGQAISMKILSIRFQNDAKVQQTTEPPTLWRIGVARSYGAVEVMPPRVWSASNGPHCIPPEDWGNCSFNVTWYPATSGSEFAYSGASVVAFNCNCGVGGEGGRGDVPIVIYHRFVTNAHLYVERYPSCYWISPSHRWC
jgi:hypothetical protein